MCSECQEDHYWEDASDDGPEPADYEDGPETCDECGETLTVEAADPSVGIMYPPTYCENEACTAE